MKVLKVVSEIPIQGENASTDRPSAPHQASWTEHETLGRKSADPRRRSIKAVQRSRSAGHPPLTPNRKSGFSGNSRSCPPARLKSSPIKDVKKSQVEASLYIQALSHYHSHSHFPAPPFEGPGRYGRVKPRPHKSSR